MTRPLRLLVPLLALSLVLTGCLDDRSVEQDPGTAAPVGPEPAPTGPLTLESVLTIVGSDDAGQNTTFTPGDALSTSGDDLESEEDYFTGNAGTPAQCAGAVSSPYLVSEHDTGDRSDDPSYLVGTFSEVDESRFGLIQVYARQFDDATIASDFFSELTATVAACPGYTLSDGTTVTVNVTALKLTPLTGLPEGVTGVRYAETLKSSASNGVTIDFYQREGVVISVYGELTPSSTITQAQVDAIGADVAQRLALY